MYIYPCINLYIFIYSFIITNLASAINVALDAKHALKIKLNS